MASVGIIFITDAHYGLQRYSYSLPELVRSRFPDSDIAIRHINSKNISSLCRVYPHKLESLRSFIKNNDKTVCFVGVGLSDCKSGYNYQMFETHLNGIISELENLGNIDVVLMSANVSNKLTGKFCSTYLNLKRVIKETAEDFKLNLLLFKLTILFLNNDDVVVGSKSIPNMIESIQEYIDNELEVYEDK